MAGKEGDKTHIYIIVAVVVVFILGFLGFMAFYALRGQVSGYDQVGLGHAAINSNTQVGVAQSKIFENNPNLTNATILSPGTQPLPVMQLG